MTVGIGATGPRAGAGILAGLRALEAIGRGAIGGFVTLAVLTADQTLLRAETQIGGTAGLWHDTAPQALLDAPFAALISSGPNRPEPLSQFVAAAPGVGIVTGHRFPQTRTSDGRALNGIVLDLMASGQTPRAAIDAVIAAHPDYDAGFVALSTSGEIAFGNMPSVMDRRDTGAASLVAAEGTARVATIHNAIHPHRTLADMVNDVVLDDMLRPLAPLLMISVRRGTALIEGPQSEIEVDAGLSALCIRHPGGGGGPDQPRAFGLGDRVRVTQGARTLGWLGYEPFMTVEAGRVTAMDGGAEVSLPVFERVGSVV